MSYTRRQFLQASLGVGAGLSVIGCQPSESDMPAAASASDEPLYKISLAEWSLHRSIFGAGLTGDWDAFGRALHTDPSSVYLGEMSHLDFIVQAGQTYGVDGVEYVNTFFFDKAQDTAYLNEMQTRADGEGLANVLIMCDAEGDLGAPDEAQRIQAVENHYKWVEAAAYLGCHAIRVNAASAGSYEEQQRLAADGLRRLCEFADQHDIEVLVENHGGLSSNAQWLVGVMEQVEHPRVGTLPDFGNFRIREGEVYDKYQGVAELMPYAKAVSAKSHEFDAQGNEQDKDYLRLMKTVLDAGYRGYVGIEYEGSGLSEHDGILATKRLLERVRTELAPQYA